MLSSLVHLKAQCLADQEVQTHQDLDADKVILMLSLFLFFA